MKTITTVCVCLAIFMLSCQDETLRMERYQIHGIDVSHHQAEIHWDSVADENISFAFVKATEGGDHTDRRYCDNWRAMKREGIRRGAYHFFHPSSSPKRQAEHFTGLVELAAGDLPPVLDVEIVDGVSRQMLINNIKYWLFLVERHYEMKPIIYTNLQTYNRYLCGHFDDHPLWIARYNQIEPHLKDDREWKFWQYGNRGRIPGINGWVDFNVFRGAKEDLGDLCKSPEAITSSR
ncbi:MAG: GH25 family lysozyme [Saprospiraceae bacterium]|nr:GH25 family lysozyme [Saprospiraceae bacterium]